MHKLEIEKDGFNRIFVLYRDGKKVNEYYENSYCCYQYSTQDYVDGIIFADVDKIVPVSKEVHSNKYHTVLKVPEDTEVPENIVIHTNKSLKEWQYE